jgi:hypothetical protein
LSPIFGTFLVAALCFIKFKYLIQKRHFGVLGFWGFGVLGGLLAVPVAASIILILDEVVIPRANKA